MPGTPTPRLKLPIPDEDDPADVPADLTKLATALDSGGAGSVDGGVAYDSQGTFSARPAAGVRGRYYFATDTSVLYRDTGAAWVPISTAIAARAWLANTQNVGANTAVTILFDTITFDTTNGGWGDIVHNHGFAVPVTGIYQVNTAASLEQTAAPNGAFISIWRGTGGVNTELSRGTRVQTSQLAGAIGVVASDLVPANAGDFIWSGLYNLGGANAIDAYSLGTYISISRQ